MNSGLMSPRLSLAEAYLVAQSFLGHIRAVPSRVEEPVDGIVELEGAGMLSRVKYQRSPVGQGGVLALLRAAEHSDLHLALFSVTGYSDSAVSFASTRAVALFDLTAEGDVIPVTTAARAMMIDEPFTSPLDSSAYAFEESAFEPSEDEGSDFFLFEPATKTPAETGAAWRECPHCGTKHHKNAQFCAACGVDLTKRSSRLLSAPPQTGGTAVPKPKVGGPTLRCKTCGSHDIELIPGS